MQSHKLLIGAVSFRASGTQDRLLHVPESEAEPDISKVNVSSFNKRSHLEYMSSSCTQ
jgi:hypothetical protein